MSSPRLSASAGPPSKDLANDVAETSGAARCRLTHRLQITAQPAGPNATCSMGIPVGTRAIVAVVWSAAIALFAYPGGEGLFKRRAAQ